MSFLASYYKSLDVPEPPKIETPKIKPPKISKAKTPKQPKIKEPLFSGQKEEDTGRGGKRTVCYQEGEHVSCGDTQEKEEKDKPEKPKKEEQKQTRQQKAEENVKVVEGHLSLINEWGTDEQGVSDLTNSLSKLTLEQLRALKKKYNIKDSPKNKEELVNLLKDKFTAKPEPPEEKPVEVKPEKEFDERLLKKEYMEIALGNNGISKEELSKKSREVISTYYKGYNDYISDNPGDHIQAIQAGYRAANKKFNEIVKEEKNKKIEEELPEEVELPKDVIE